MNWNPFKPKPPKRKVTCTICGKAADAPEDWDGVSPQAHWICQYAERKKLEREAKFTEAELRQIEVIKQAMTEWHDEKCRNELFPRP